MDQLGSTAAAMPLRPQLFAVFQDRQRGKSQTVGPKKSGGTTAFLPLQTVIFGDFDTVYSDGPDSDLSQNVGWLHTVAKSERGMASHSCCCLQKA